nr:hypothetical protein KPHV_67110 [Kitasatospora purpeofusca]
MTRYPSGPADPPGPEPLTVPPAAPGTVPSLILVVPPVLRAVRRPGSVGAAVVRAAAERRA